MSDFNNGYSRPVEASADTSVDAGLRAFMLGVYNKLALGLLLAAAVAWTTGNVPEVSSLLFTRTAEGLLSYTTLGMIVAFSPLVMIFGSMFFMRNAGPGAANILYWLVVLAIGAGLGVIFLIYTGASIVSTFLITAAAFGALSLWGYTTKRNMTGWGSFLIMGVIGLLIAMVVNMFLQSPMMYFVINAVGVLLFSGLIAYDTQRLKLTYYTLGGNQAAMSSATSWGALALFINFVNLFQFLLSFLGSRE